jgi:septum formation protein
MLRDGAPPLILASQSAARHALLAAAGIAVTARPARIDEAAVKQSARAEGQGPGETALLLAELKAARIRDPDAIVIGADQLLTCEGAWFDKPEDVAAARDQLRALRGRAHVLHTAVVCHRGGQRIWQHVATPRLTMRDFSDAFLEAYLAIEGAQVTASVGAYRLEGPGVQLFAAVEGEHAAILGLPLLALLGFLRQHGVLLD